MTTDWLTGIYLGPDTVLNHPNYVTRLRDEIGLNTVVISFTGEMSKDVLALSPFKGRVPTDDELAELAKQLPASASSDYGAPFYDIFKRYNYDFYKIDPLLFSPGEVWLTSAASGRTFHAGRLNPEVLRASLYGN